MYNGEKESSAQRSMLFLNIIKVLIKKMSLDLLCDTSKNKTSIVEMRISVFNLTEAFEIIDLSLNAMFSPWK